MNVFEGRQLSWHRERKPDPRDFWLQLPSAAPRPAIVELQNRVPAIWDQGREGACVGFGVARAIAARVAQAGFFASHRPSPAWIYAIARIAQGSFPEDSGTSITGAIKQVYKRGYVLEPSFPYSDKSYRIRPSESVYSDALKRLIKSYHRVTQTIEFIEQTMASGFEVIIGVDVHENFKPDKKGVIPMPKGSLRGGHCIVLDSYNAKQKLFGFTNSWGPGWGSKGRGFFHYEFIADQNLTGDLTVIEGLSGQIKTAA